MAGIGAEDGGTAWFCRETWERGKKQQQGGGGYGSSVAGLWVSRRTMGAGIDGKLRQSSSDAIGFDGGGS